MIQNASLELDDNNDGVLNCWQRGRSGTNAATFALTSEAFDGTVAQRIDMTSYTSGARRIVTLQADPPQDGEGPGVVPVLLESFCRLLPGLLLGLFLSPARSEDVTLCAASSLRVNNPFWV